MIAVSRLCVGAGTFSLRGVSFTVAAGTHAVLTGPSGTGKTTLLEAICGLRRVESGQVHLAGREVTHLPPAERGIGFVPQDGALFPHLSVRENAAFALRIRGWDSARQQARIAELAGGLGLSALLDRSPAGLSGGERQRVALARALAARPPLLLLDEPFSALDSQSRTALRGILHDIRRRDGVTVLHVTHDAADAEALAEQIIQLPAAQGKPLEE